MLLLSFKAAALTSVALFLFAAVLSRATARLPFPWSSHVDPRSGDVYYWNSETRESQWSMPEALRWNDSGGEGGGEGKGARGGGEVAVNPSRSPSATPAPTPSPLMTNAEYQSKVENNNRFNMELLSTQLSFPPLFRAQLGKRRCGVTGCESLHCGREVCGVLVCVCVGGGGGGIDRSRV